jgi:hypothetical protein
MKSFRPYSCVVAIGLTVTAGFAAEVQTSSPGVGATISPEAKTILARYTEALGGESAVKQHTAQESKVSIKVAAMGGVELKGERLAQAPNQLLTTIEVPGTGAISFGYDGKDAWYKFGGTIMEMTGDQLKNTRRDADFWRMTDPAKSYKSIAAKGVEKVGNTDCQVLEGVTLEGRNEKLFFAKDSGLLRRWDFQGVGDDTQKLAVLLIDDYRNVDGIKVPFTLQMEKPTEAAFEMHLTEVKFPATIDTSRFKKPAN